MFAVLPCQLAMAHACRKWQDHGISLNWTGRSEDTEGTGVRVGVWMRQGAPPCFGKVIESSRRSTEHPCGQVTRKGAGSFDLQAK